MYVQLLIYFTVFCLVHVCLQSCHVYRLTPGAKYYYVYGGGPYGYSKESYFVAPPIPSRTATTKILAYGGMMMSHYFETSIPT